MRPTAAERRRLTPPPPPTEHQEQTALFKWAALAAKSYPGLELMFAVPNGSRCNIGAAVKLKAEGVKKGIPDVFLPVPWGGKPGLFIEMKRVRGGQLSSAQKEVIGTLRAWGYAVEVCPGFEADKTAIEEYFKGYRPTIGGHHEKA